MNNSVHRHALLKDIEQKLNIKEPSDWYKHTKKDMIRHGGNPLLYYYDNSPSKVLQNMYPDYNWDLTKYVLTR
jgi:hypothetical protein